jgi:hypothetical protein
MTRFAGERLIRTKDDPDLGCLELWAWPRPRAFLDLLKPREEYLEWRGMSGRLVFVVGVDRGVEPDTQLAFLDTQARAVIASLADREPALRRETARREIGLARDWSGNNDLSEDVFAESLRGSEVAVYTDADNTIVDLYLEDTANIFAGHIVTVSLDRSGNIVSTGLDG